MHFGRRLKALREARNLTQRELGAILGLSDRAIGYYETSERFPSEDILTKLADFFNVSMDDLFGRAITLSVDRVAEESAHYNVPADDPRVLEIAQELRQRNLPPEVLDKVVDLARALAQLEREHPAKNNKNRQK